MTDRKLKKSAKAGPTMGFFNDIPILVIPMLIAKKRLSLFENNVIRQGGVWCSSNEVKTGKQRPSYIVIEDVHDEKSVEKVRRDFKHGSSGSVIVSTRWLSECIRQNELVPTKDYEPQSSGPVTEEESIPSKRLKGNDSSVNEETPHSSTEQSTPIKMSLKLDKFACSQSSASLEVIPDGNKIIIQELQKLADAFRNKGDTWRSHGYTKAISAIRRCGKTISTYEEAVALPGVGEKIASKVWEILESGSLRKVSEVCDNEKTKVLEIFNNVWGAGPSTAESWFQQGCRTLQDVQEKISLTKQQVIGVKHYDDFLKRIPREEVERIGKLVSDAALTVEPHLQCELVGSYRRGKESCGDIDVMICKPDHMVSKDILTHVLTSLKQSGLITDDLVSLETHGNQRKYLGVCRLPGDDQKFRRLDIFVVPRSELATALMHYTGSALFNRSIRLLAAKKGMSLSEHSLHAGIVREGMTVLNEGYVIPTPTEESVFEALGLEYRPPAERNH